MKKRKRKFGEFKFPDMIFRLGVSKYTGTVEAQDGVLCFYCPEHQIVTPVSWMVTADERDQLCTMLVREWDNKPVQKLGRYEVLIDDIEDDEDIFDISNLEDVADILQSHKIKLVPYAMFIIAAVLICIVAFGISFFVGSWLIRVISGIVFAGCVVSYILLSKYLDSRVVYDAEDNWVDLDSGDSNILYG